MEWNFATMEIEDEYNCLTPFVVDLDYEDDTTTF